MHAVVSTSNGGYDRLEFRLVPTPAPAAGEVLVRVHLVKWRRAWVTAISASKGR